MTYRLLLCLLLLGLVPSINAQKEANYWYFCDFEGLDFSSGTPVIDTDHQMNTFEGCVSYADEWGNLLFYSNGGGRDPNVVSSWVPGAIWNSNDELMYDMSYTEGGGWSAIQSCLTVPDPNAPDRMYYLFTMDEFEYNDGGVVPDQPLGRGLSYFKIDMEGNNGLGGVVVADQRVYVPLMEALDGTIHANQQDYWVIVIDHFYFNDPNLPNRIGVLLVSESGVSDIEWTTITGDLAGYIRVAPNGQWICVRDRLFQFDNATGEVTDLQLSFDFGFNTSSNGYAFSPNSKYLYYRAENALGLSTSIYRFDLEATDIAGSMELITSYPGDLSIGQIQIGPDGNLYYFERPLSGPDVYLSVIRCPNSPNPTVEQGIVSYSSAGLGNYSSLPNFMDHIFSTQQPGIVDIGPDTLYLCPGETYEIGGETALGGYSWNNGQSSPYITIAEPGTYILNAEHACGTVSDTLVALQLPPASIPEISGPEELCSGDTIQLMASPLQNFETGIWSTGEISSTIPITTEGTYHYAVLNGCGDSTFVFWEVDENPSPAVEIIPDFPPPYCEDEILYLTATANDATEILWFNGETDDQVFIQQDAWVWVQVENQCGIADDSLLVNFSPPPTAAFNVIGDPPYCLGDTVILQSAVSDADSFEWSDGSDNTNLQIVETGSYFLQAFNTCGFATNEIQLSFEDCTVVEPDSCISELPTAFSPNQDGVNDRFGLIKDCALINDFQLSIFNRWGELVFESTDPAQKWDGSFQGEPCPSEVYVWKMYLFLEGEEEGFTTSGELTLLR
jgi:gliding motility-associated-like protein